MISANNKILVQVDYNQKQSAEIGGVSISLGKEYSTNRRESNPVVCKVVEGNLDIKAGVYLLVHHNRFVETSPHHLGDNFYSLAYNTAIFARLDENGNPIGLCDNIFVEYIRDDYDLIPPQLQTVDKFKYKVLSDGFGYKKDDVIFCYEFSNYEVVYVWEGIEKRVVKVAKKDIVGKIQE